MLRPTTLGWLLVGVGLLLWGLALVRPFDAPPESPYLDADFVPPATWLPMVIVAWVGFLGASIGSFLNVVVWRMPRGASIITRASHCPRCDQPIRWYHNVPVFGWLWLRGRCRDCRAPIAPRYPLVELLTGLLWLGLFYAEVLHGARNLPGQLPWSDHPLAWSVLIGQGNVVRMFAYHAALVSCLVAAALIDVDGQRLPRSLIRFGVVLGLSLPLGFPPAIGDLSVNGLYPVDFRGGLGAAEVSLGSLLATGLGGLAAGGALGSLLDRLGGGTSNGRGTLTLVGAFLGWQAVVAIAGLAVLGRLVMNVARREFNDCPELPVSVAIAGATLAQLAVWRTTAGWSWWPGPTTSLGCQLAAVATTCAAAWLGGRLALLRPSRDPREPSLVAE